MQVIKKQGRSSQRYIFIVIFAVCFAFCSEIISAAPNYDLGRRYLKLGNTYREANEFEKALEFLQKGQKFFKNQSNFNEKYWYAVSLEYLGYYYRDTKQFNRAKSSLSEAEMIFADIITQVDGSDVAVSQVLSGLKNSNMKRNCPKNPQNFHCDPYKGHNQNVCHSPFDAASMFENMTFDAPHFCPKFRQQVPYNQSSVLNLNNRNLTDFPGDFTDNRVDYLSMCGNQLQRVPERINHFPTLQVLKLSNNKISQFPFLSNLKRLQTLDLSHNNLTEIGAGIGELTSLEYLILSNNPITYISNAIFKLKNLKVLDIRNTKLTRYFIDDLFSKLPTTIIIYDTTPTQANGNNFNEEDLGWGTDDEDDFNLEWEDW